MKRIVLLFLLAAGPTLALQQALAQKAKTRTQAKTPAKPVKIQEVNVTLGQSGRDGGAVTKRDFDAFAKQGLRLGSEGKITGFSFTYAERMLYEDSAGNPLLQTDYLVERCMGDVLSDGVRSTLFERTKPGDTAFFDDIRVALPTGGEARGKMMKFVITK